jgi:hypothetical protein
MCVYVLLLVLGSKPYGCSGAGEPGAAARGLNAISHIFTVRCSSRARGARAATVRRTLATFALDSPSFPDLRARHDAYVDKASAIADLLVGDAGTHRHTRAFFARPRKFGKSLTLDTMLAAGDLPAGVAPWPGRVPVDVDAVFGGLAVHERLRARDPVLRGLLQRAHFVVKLALGGATSGAKV